MRMRNKLVVVMDGWMKSSVSFCYSVSIITNIKFIVHFILIYIDSFFVLLFVLLNVCTLTELMFINFEFKINVDSREEKTHATTTHLTWGLYMHLVLW